jgi:hypothetical protein
MTLSRIMGKSYAKNQFLWLVAWKYFWTIISECSTGNPIVRFYNREGREGRGKGLIKIFFVSFASFASFAVEFNGSFYLTTDEHR